MDKSDALCALLGLKVPIFQGGMAWASDATLAGAVSSNGGLGIIGAGGRHIGWIIEQIEVIRKLTIKPFAVNLPLEDLSDYQIDERLEALLALDSLLITVSGSRRYLRLFDRYPDFEIIPLVGTVMEAKLAERGGAKVVICEGQESGGSIGKLSLFSLLPQVVDSVSIPVVAAGGIADGRGMAAAFALGASGIQMGTRFLASKESSVCDAYKKIVVKARDSDSRVMFAPTQKPVRVLVNTSFRKYAREVGDGESADSLEHYRKGGLRRASAGDIENGLIQAGEIAGMVESIEPAAEILNTVISGFKAIALKGGSFLNLDKQVPLRHDFPLLMIDAIEVLEPLKYCRARFYLRPDFWAFGCHYRGYPVMPGSLLLEAMSQAMTLVVQKESVEPLSSTPVLITKIENVKFLEQVEPDTELHFEVHLGSFKRGLATGNVVCLVGEKEVCRCRMQLVDPDLIGKHLPPK